MIPAAHLLLPEQERMIFRSPHPDVSIPAQSLTDFVLGSPRARPEDTALVDASTGRVLTYAELQERVKRVASGLPVLGVRKADVVALCLPNSPEFASVFHAVACLGATLTTMNPASTAQELAYQLVDSNAKLIVSTGALADRVRVAVEARSPGALRPSRHLSARALSRRAVHGGQQMARPLQIGLTGQRVAQCFVEAVTLFHSRCPDPCDLSLFVYDKYSRDTDESRSCHPCAIYRLGLRVIHRDTVFHIFAPVLHEGQDAIGSFLET
jgi:hypothetical protein